MWKKCEQYTVWARPCWLGFTVEVGGSPLLPLTTHHRLRLSSLVFRLPSLISRLSYLVYHIAYLVSRLPSPVSLLPSRVSPLHHPSLPLSPWNTNSRGRGQVDHQQDTWPQRGVSLTASKGGGLLLVERGQFDHQQSWRMFAGWRGEGWVWLPAEMTAVWEGWYWMPAGVEDDHMTERDEFDKLRGENLRCGNSFRMSLKKDDTWRETVMTRGKMSSKHRRIKQHDAATWDKFTKNDACPALEMHLKSW